MATKKERQEKIKRAERAFMNVMELLGRGEKGRDMGEKLLTRCGSPSAAIESSKYRLMQMGMREADALLLTMLPDIARHIDRAGYGPHPKLSTLLAMEKFLRLRYLGVYIENFYLIALDKNGRLIDTIHLQSGDEDSASFYLRNVMVQIVRSGAKAVVIVHNHPNGTANPSDQDIECTQALLDIIGSIGVLLLDHVVMVGKHAISMRGFGYIPEYGWLIQAPESKLLKEWLKGWSMDKTVELLAKRTK